MSLRTKKGPKSSAGHKSTASSRRQQPPVPRPSRVTRSQRQTRAEISSPRTDPICAARKAGDEDATRLASHLLKSESSHSSEKAGESKGVRSAAGTHRYATRSRGAVMENEEMKKEQEREQGEKPCSDTATQTAGLELPPGVVARDEVEMKRLEENRREGLDLVALKKQKRGRKMSRTENASPKVEKRAKIGKKKETMRVSETVEETPKAVERKSKAEKKSPQDRSQKGKPVLENLHPYPEGVPEIASIGQVLAPLLEPPGNRTASFDQPIDHDSKTNPDSTSIPKKPFPHDININSKNNASVAPDPFKRGKKRKTVTFTPNLPTFHSPLDSSFHIIDPNLEFKQRQTSHNFKPPPPTPTALSTLLLLSAQMAHFLRKWERYLKPILPPGTDKRSDPLLRELLIPRKLHQRVWLLYALLLCLNPGTSPGHSATTTQTKARSSNGSGSSSQKRTTADLTTRFRNLPGALKEWWPPVSREAQLSVLQTLVQEIEALMGLAISGGVDGKITKLGIRGVCRDLDERGKRFTLPPHHPLFSPKTKPTLKPESAEEKKRRVERARFRRAGLKIHILSSRIMGLVNQAVVIVEGTKAENKPGEKGDWGKVKKIIDASKGEMASDAYRDLIAEIEKEGLRERLELVSPLSPKREGLVIGLGTKQRAREEARITQLKASGVPEEQWGTVGSFGGGAVAGNSAGGPTRAAAGAPTSLFGTGPGSAAGARKRLFGT